MISLLEMLLVLLAGHTGSALLLEGALIICLLQVEFHSPQVSVSKSVVQVSSGNTLMMWLCFMTSPTSSTGLSLRSF